MPARRQLPYLLLAFLGGTAVALVLGAVNTGVAFSIGTLCFAATLVWLILSE